MKSPGSLPHPFDPASRPPPRPVSAVGSIRFEDGSLAVCELASIEPVRDRPDTGPGTSVILAGIAFLFIAATVLRELARKG